jgi:hypothetical protein
MRTAILALVICAACLRLSAQIQTYQTGTWPAIRLAAQESGGLIHAAGSGEDSGEWILSEDWQPGDNSPWKPWVSSNTSNAVPQSMETAADGSVVSIWTNKSEGGIFVLSQRGNTGVVPQISGLAGPTEFTTVLVDSKSNLWVTEDALNIYRVATNQDRTLVHVITDRELRPGSEGTYRLPVSMVEDARGRIWFWSSRPSSDDSHGVLIYENGAVTHRPALEGVPEGLISVIAPLNGAELWLAVSDNGIYSVNLDTLQGVRVADPETNAFRTVQHIFSVGEDRYVITGSDAEFNKDGLLGVLWRRRGGNWTKLIDGLDAKTPDVQFEDRRWSVTKEGLWLGSFGMGGWFVPVDDRPPFAINWQVNSPIDSINRWFQLKGRQMLGLQFGRGAIVADPALLTQPPARTPSAIVLHTDSPLLQTDDGHVFSFLPGRQRMLSEWEGRSWHDYPLPEHFEPGTPHNCIMDSLNRIWWVNFSSSPEGDSPTYVFDSTSQHFEVDSNYASAFQAQAPHQPGLRLRAIEQPEYSRYPSASLAFGVYLSGWAVPRNGDSGASVSADGRIGFEYAGWIYYFNDTGWQKWEVTKISQPEPGIYPPVNVFFASDGSLAFEMDDVTWSFSEAQGWRTNADVHPPKKSNITPAKNRASAVPPPSASIGSAVTDSLGISWLTAGGKLFRSAFGLTRSCFDSNEPQPFIDGRKLTDVFTDNLGNAFLRTSLPDRDEYVFVPAREPLARATAALVENDLDGVTLQLAANIPSPFFFWLVDDAPWDGGATNQTLRLDRLSAGRHRVQVVALDERLQAGPPAAGVSFETPLAPLERIQKWIAQLDDKNYALREAAVKGLFRNAKLALPALREALKRESDPDRRWWLDAAIQECSQ